MVAVTSGPHLLLLKPPTAALHLTADVPRSATRGQCVQCLQPVTGFLEATNHTKRNDKESAGAD